MDSSSVNEKLRNLLRRDESLESRPSQREWFAQIAQDEPVGGEDAAKLIAEARAEREKQLSRRLRHR